jgi:hypothetical protein
MCNVDSDCITPGDHCNTIIRNGASEHICSSRCTPGGASCPVAPNGNNASCVSFDTGTTFLCYQSCASAAMCPNPGEACVTETGGTTTQICLPAGTSTGTARSYQPCSVDGDCASSSDRCIQIVYQGGTERICSSTCTPAATACPSGASGIGGSCVSFDSGATFHCYQSCSGSNVCSTSEQCVPEGSTSICLPRGSTTGVPAYSGCAMGMTCQSPSQCTGVKNGTRTLDLCTVAHCTTDADCPLDRRGGNGLCFQLDGDSFSTCIERCNVTNDCTYGSMGAETCTRQTLNGATLPVLACLPT